jgi:hypothetical protein
LKKISVNINYCLSEQNCIDVCVWAQILKRVVIGFSWYFNTIIWYLYVFDFAHVENFGSCCWKHRRGIFLIVRIIYFNFDHFWNFLICCSGVISGFPETTYFSGVYTAKFGKLFFWSYLSLVNDSWKKLEKNIFLPFF